MPTKVLVIDDDPDFRQAAARYLRLNGFEVLAAADGTEGLLTNEAQMPHLVILDIIMPKLDGWHVCQRLRDVSCIPIMMVTGLGQERDRLRGFDLGIDDYMVKPVSLPEMVARVRAILARYKAGAPRPATPIMRGNVQIDLAKRQVTRNGHTIHLTPTEYRLLVALLAARGHPVSPEVLVARVWGEEGARSLDNLKSYISYLRQKIEPDPEQPQIILNARGFGYLLAETLP